MSAADDATVGRLLCSFVPALMLKAIDKNKAITPPTSHQYEAVALFADISGFSALTEHFSQHRGEGLGYMMSLVNMYFQQMIKITAACGGDIIKFAGDALIVLWTDGPKSVQAHRACECAMELQDALHDCPMTQTIRLSLKARRQWPVGVGIGPITMFYVGGHGGRCEYFAAGPALRECFVASDSARSGDVIASDGVWKEVEAVCEGTEQDNGFHALVSMERTFRKRGVQRAGLSPHDVSYAVRVLSGYAPPVLLSAHVLEASLGQSMRGWTVSVVQASVLFVNLGIGGLMDQLALDCNKIHTAVVTVQRIVQTLGGCIHRFTVDDKGCVMKLVFGAHLPHEDQPYRALLAALQLRHTLSLQGIQPAIGVASGESLIGPVGSAVRQEFTVHGAPIILAARLMQLATKYGGMVLCDEGTFTSTRDDVRFVQLQPVALKGRSAVVRPYRPVASSELLEKPTLTVKPPGKYCFPLETIRRALDECAGWLRSTEAPAFRALVVTGAHGAGKTQLVMQARACFEPSCRVLHVRCRAHEAGQRGALLRRLFAQLCGHDVWPSLQHMTPMLASSASASADEALIDYELKMLHSHSAAWGCGNLEEGGASDGVSDGAAHFSAASPPRLRGRGLCSESTAACDQPFDDDSHEAAAAAAAAGAEAAARTAGASGGRLAIAIDDVHHADAHSCEVLTRFARSAPPKLFLVMTCREHNVSLGRGSTSGSCGGTPASSCGGSPACARADGGGFGGGEAEGVEAPQEVQQFSAGHRLVHTLTATRDAVTPLNLRSVGPAGCDDLACAELGVQSIPAEVVVLLARRSGGSPLLSQAVARNLVRRGALIVDSEHDCCRLGLASSERLLNAAATEALVEARHSVLCVKIADLSILQQVVLKTMALLPEPCPQALLMHAVPVQIELGTLVAALRALRNRHLITAPSTHRRSLPEVLSPSPHEAVYSFVDVGMREVCQHLMVESQKRQIRLKIAAANESKQVLGSLADSLSSSFGGETPASSPSMLRRSLERPLSTSPAGQRAGATSPSHGHKSFRTSGSEADLAHWWLARSGGNSRLSGSSPAHRFSSSSGKSPSRFSPARWQLRSRQEHAGGGRLNSGRLTAQISRLTSSSLSPSMPSRLSGRSRARTKSIDRLRPSQLFVSTPSPLSKASPASSPWHSFTSSSRARGLASPALTPAQSARASRRARWTGEASPARSDSPAPRSEASASPLSARRSRTERPSKIRIQMRPAVRVAAAGGGKRSRARLARRVVVRLVSPVVSLLKPGSPLRRATVRPASISPPLPGAGKHEPPSEDTSDQTEQLSISTEGGTKTPSEGSDSKRGSEERIDLSPTPGEEGVLAAKLVDAEKDAEKSPPHTPHSKPSRPPPSSPVVVVLPPHELGGPDDLKRSLDGRMATLGPHSSDGLALLVGSHRTARSNAARRLFT